MSAIDLFSRFQIDAAKLTALQRILLVTDGTLTEILEAHFLERIELVKLSESQIERDGLPFATEANETAVERKILLRGATSGTTYVHAQSLILAGRLSQEFRRELVETVVPLGRLWRHHRLETHKQLVAMGERLARDLVLHFECQPDSRLLSRTYDVFSSGRAVMRISELFPAWLRG